MFACFTEYVDAHSGEISAARRCASSQSPRRAASSAAAADAETFPSFADDAAPRPGPGPTRPDSVEGAYPRVGFAHAVVLREVIRARVRSHAAKTPTRLRHHRARFPRDVFGGDANGGFPRDLQRVLILRHLRGEFQVGVHRAGVIPVRLERACPREHGVHRGGGFSPLALASPPLAPAARASSAISCFFAGT